LHGCGVVELTAHEVKQKKTFKLLNIQTIQKRKVLAILSMFLGSDAGIRKQLSPLVPFEKSKEYICFNKLVTYFDNIPVRTWFNLSKRLE
jgi:hypothetical protein